ncbi:hypothetical protein FA15DRAFT_687097 [Coprinopsis marcescibilis]|uniref:BSD domain-containing protein n=1 Tax=Coprinopsis marcescibilis TaxID=230819 RepID=A0A5C3KY08_COPMA|nr:hypothetical protein FA15DRAFT_687097 [Coprinopsis marcescibilis]
MPTTVCSAKASCKKVSGLLELTDSHLQWTQDGKKTPSIRVAHHEAASLFCSKESAAQVRLKIGVHGNENGHNFTFTSEQPIAYQEREKFKIELTTIIGRNKQQGAEKASGLALPFATPSSGPSTPATNGSAAKSTSARPPQISSAGSRAQSVASDSRATPTIVGNDPAADFHLRKKVLMNNPELGTLHRELVMSGQISEAEFWDGREHLLLAQAAADSQRKGKPGQIVDPRPETVEGGEIKIRITPQLIHDVFYEYPVVAKAYSENVPKALSEEEFWKRYFQSKLFNANRASIRSSATQHVVKDDPIFDKYLEKEDDGLEPIRQREGRTELFIDLGATNEDHGEATVQKDITMRAGRQKGALPLIRKFNEHSERLLNSALGDNPTHKRRRLNTDEAYAEIELDDLHADESTDGIVLDMKDRQRYFEGKTGAIESQSVFQPTLDYGATLREAKASCTGWEKVLNQLHIERKYGDAALFSLTENVDARLRGRSKKNDIPDGLFRQMTTCQTAANEFLRQFWSSALPPSVDISTINVATPAQRATKSAKMIGYLSKTQEKVNALIQVAQRQGLDPSRIETASTLMFLTYVW